MLTAVLAAAALAATPAAPAAPAMPSHEVMEPQTIPSSFDWRVQPGDKDAQPGTVQLEFGYRTEHHSSTWGHDVALSTLDGLSAQALNGAGGPVMFVIRRDAGDFRCTGVAGQGRGTGTCAYAPNAGFAAGLGKRGVSGRPTDWQQFELAFEDIGFAYLDELKRQRYATPAVDDLVRAGQHGAGLKQLQAMDAAGYRFDDVATLVRLRDHGVSARYVEALNGYGYHKLAADQLQRMRDHGVSATYVGELSQHGYRGVSPEDLAGMRDHGVSATFVAELDAMGYGGLKPETLERLRDHGVSASFIRRANESGQKLDADALIRLRDGGGRP
jgi:hypothetical protein